MGTTAALAETTGAARCHVNHNHDLKSLFKSAATQAGTSKDDPLGEFYQNLLARGMEPPMARA